MTNVTNMFTNNEDVSVLRNNGYGSANFNIATTPLMYDTGTDTLNISKKIDLEKETKIFMVKIIKQ